MSESEDSEAMCEISLIEHKAKEAGTNLIKRLTLLLRRSKASVACS
jgi:hypothetical protein